jgi:hypothetical protein
MLNDQPTESLKPDDDSAFCDECLALTTLIQKGVLVGVQGQYDRYLEICGCSTLDSGQWLTKEDYLLFLLCKGLGYGSMKFSDIINQALVAGCIEAAKFNNKMEKKLNITESE